MEIEQVVGVVRHLIAQNQGLMYLDDALSLVLKSKETLAAHKKESEELVALVDSLKHDQEALLSSQKQAEIDHNMKMAALTAAQVSVAQKEMDHLAASKLVLEDNLKAGAHLEADMKDRIQLLQGEIAALELEKAGVEGDLVQVKKAIASITSNLAKV